MPEAPRSEDAAEEQECLRERAADALLHQAALRQRGDRSERSLRSHLRMRRAVTHHRDLHRELDVGEAPVAELEGEA
jgi:hypothetical protein